jgi:hypothetical protein
MPSTLRAGLEKDPGIGSTWMQKARWYIFEVSSDADLRRGLKWLSPAYGAAGQTKKSC